MGISYSIWVGEPLNAEQKKQIETVICACFTHVDKVFNYWNPASEIALLGKLPALEKRALSPALLALLHKVDTLYTISKKKFDITIAPLLILYREAFQKGVFPSPEKVAEAQQLVGWGKVHLENNVLWKEESEITFDLGGIAKGVAVDLITEKLQALGYSSLYVEWGGEIRTVGSHPSGRKWRILIENSDQVVELENRAIATSGDYYQYWRVGEREYFHIIDPESQKPLERKKGLGSATVIAPTCYLADAVATILMFYNTEEERKLVMQAFPECNYISTSSLDPGRAFPHAAE